MDHLSRRSWSDKVIAEVETLDRVVAIRVLVDPMCMRQRLAHPDVLHELSCLVGAAEAWAKRAAA